MATIQVTKSGGNDYTVTVDSYEYVVILTQDYWEELTGGTVSQEELIKRSFEFLLSHEGPESILKEFELPLINHYFPDFEAAIKKEL